MRTILNIFTILFIFATSQIVLQAQDPAAEDPYIWLEEIEGEKSMDWVKAQNELSGKVLTASPVFEPLRQKYFEALNDKDKIAYPTMVGDYVYNLWRDENNQRGLWRRMEKKGYLNNSGEWETVIDIDALAEKEGKKWVFAGATWLAPDNKLCLVALSDGGTDENEMREFDAETKTFVENGLLFPSSKGGVAWINEDKVLVARNFGKGTLTTSGYPRQAKLLDRGTILEDTPVLFETAENHVGVFVGSYYSEGKMHAVVFNAKSFYDSELHYISDNGLQQLNLPHDADTEGFHKNQVIISLKSDWFVNETVFPQGTLVSFDLDDNITGEFEVNTIYAPDENSSYVDMSSSKSFITVNSLENVQNALNKYEFTNGKWVATSVETPGFGSINLISSSDQTDDFYFLYSNFISPRTLYHATSEETKIAKKLADKFDTSNLVVNQYRATSKDGTEVPYFIVHGKDISLNGQNATIISAYGGFGVSNQPNYQYTMGMGWLEKGGVYVLANIRGGGEFGPAWHQAAMKEKKQNSYDDVYAIAEDLIERKITTPERLGAIGWSNGGLMTGVLYTQRPDLFNAMVVGVPLLDMKRYSKLLAGASWIGEYGDPDKPEDWEYIKAYSPYHNLQPTGVYPEVYFVTSSKDDRVHPGHARKMAARMKEMGHPYLYYETIEGGHGAAITTKQQAYMFASIYTYFNIKLNSTALSKIKG